MDKKISKYNPTSSMSVVNFTFNRFPANAETTALTVMWDDVVQAAKEKYPLVQLRLPTLIWRQEGPVLQVCLRHQCTEKRLYDDIVRAVEDRIADFCPSFYIKNVTVDVNPLELQL